MIWFGILFIVSTTLVFIFKKEVEPINDAKQQDKNTEKLNSEGDEEEDGEESSIEDNLTVKETYQLMWKILWLIPIKKLIIILMTVKIAFAAESMQFLKIIEAGVPKEKLSLLAVPLTPLQIVLPLLISRYTNGPNPFNFFIKAIPFRLFMGLVAAAWVYVTPYFKDANNEYPFYYYVICLIINMVHSVFAYSMFVSQMSFFAQISDKSIGGTYMTFLNTLSNLGGNWPSTSALYLASFLTFKTCSLNSGSGESAGFNNNNNTCSTEAQIESCTKAGGVCSTWLDAFYLETLFLTIFGIFWILKYRKIMFHLQDLPKFAWKISK
jgi:PAT family acetyl-CoA transporter-like MFS transporter 1